MCLSGGACLFARPVGNADVASSRPLVYFAFIFVQQRAHKLQKLQPPGSLECTTFRAKLLEMLKIREISRNCA